MLRSLALIGVCAVSVLAIGCTGDNNQQMPRDFSHSNQDLSAGNEDMPGNPDGGSSSGCKSYTTATVATMRQGKSGCYELDNVVSISAKPVSSKSTSATIYVQDAAGGDFSAVSISCSSGSSSHPCSVLSDAKAIAAASTPDSAPLDGGTPKMPHSVTVKGTFIRSSSTMYENFYIDSITDNGAGTPPAAANVTLADIKRSATSAKYWNQRVTADLGSDTLKMFDFSPPEFAYMPLRSTCPTWFGFGMLPSSASGTAAPACSGTTTQPTGQTTVNADEVLIGTDFFYGFTVSADCRCAAMFSNKEPTASSTISSSISGILVFDVPYMATSGYQYLAPMSNSDAAFTNLQ